MRPFEHGKSAATIEYWVIGGLSTAAALSALRGVSILLVTTLHAITSRIPAGW